MKNNDENDNKFIEFTYIRYSIYIDWKSEYPMLTCFYGFNIECKRSYAKDSAIESELQIENLFYIKH